MKRVTIRHAGGEYEVVIGAGILAEAGAFEMLGSRPVMIVTDENVAALWLGQVQARLPAAKVLVLPAGETAKTLASTARIWSALAENGYGRDSVLVALGGGVIGDITGFAASCWMRGIAFIQVPTTLLAQVDASVGGKTGVDLPEGKNLVGAFHQPMAVLADVDTLQTLPARDYAAGFAEIIKAALLADPAFLEWLETNAAALVNRDSELLAHAIERSCEIKAEIVAEDEREHGRRALLNLGHTFAHALESATGYAEFLHGEAVAIGLVLAAALSEKQCGLDTALRPRLVALLADFGLPARLPANMQPHALLHAMRLDKKHVQACWRLVLLEAPGKAAVHEFANEDEVRRVLESGMS